MGARRRVPGPILASLASLFGLVTVLTSAQPTAAAPLAPAISTAAAAASSAQAAVTGWVRVRNGSALNVRTGPSTRYAAVRRARNGSALALVCQVVGQSIRGSVRATALWDRLSDGRYVSDAYVVYRSRPPRCPMRGSAEVESRLNLRRNASTLLSPIGRVGSGAGLSIVCQLGGQTIAGSERTTSLWDRLASGQFVTDSYVEWPAGRPSVPWCTYPSGPVPAKGNAFINWVAPYARATMKTYRVPASVTIAQAIHESGWGRSGLTANGNSYFGMKCFGSPGPVALGCRPFRTTECNQNNCFRTSAAFRVYATRWASFVDHGRSLAMLSRYRNAFRYVNNPNQFAIEIHKAGYATGSSYSRSLIQIMRQYNLYRFDRGVLT